MAKTLNLIIFILLPFILFTPISSNSELSSLMQIKSSLDPRNKILQSWKTDGDPCSGTFEGVACNENRKIANISLQGRNLAGKLSPAIGELKCLSGLYLHYNSLSGEIPAEIANLTELIELYLNVNNFSGIIPSEISHMDGLQVLDLCCNKLTGNIPTTLGSLRNLNVLSLQYNQLNDTIPPSLGNLRMLKRLDLSYNRFLGPVPLTIVGIQPLRFLDVRNNSLSGAIPTALKRLKTGFCYGNNTDLCGAGFPSLRACTSFDTANVDIVNTPQPFGSNILKNHTTPKKPEAKKTSNLQTNRTHPPTLSNHTSRFPHAVIFVSAITVFVTLATVALLTFFRFRRHKQKIGSKEETAERRISTDPAVVLAYNSPVRWDTVSADNLKFGCDLEEVEIATQYFSEANILGKGNFSSVYKGVLRDGSIVAIKSVRLSSCKAEEKEFMNGMNLLASLRHENIVGLRGFCCSRGRGECFLVYEFVPNGNLSKYLDVENGSPLVLDWATRVNIIYGIAKGLHYLHQENATKSPVVHQSICAEKILTDDRYNPLISDSGLPKILADDTIFSTLKMSAAMGYLAPEYITTGRFTEKTDVYAFGVTILQVLSGKQKITNAMRLSAESSTLEGLIDRNLNGSFSVLAGSVIIKLGLRCTEEVPGERPNMEDIVREMKRLEIQKTRD